MKKRIPAPTLKEMMNLGTALGVDSDSILDAWNHDRRKLRKSYKEILSNVKQTTPTKEEMIDLFAAPPTKKSPKKAKPLSSTERRVLRYIMNGFRHDVTSEERDGKFCVDITITHTMSDAREETTIRFDLPASIEDDDIRNSIDACISDISFVMLFSL